MIASQFPKLNDSISIGLLVAATIYAIRGTTPPHKALDSERDQKDIIHRLKLVNTGVPRLVHAILIGLAAWQTRAILDPTLSWNQNLELRLLHGAACAVTCFGGWLRLWCYKELGRFFTFGIAIRKDHEVIQSGPYAYMRHPSYTALVFIMLGLVSASVPLNPALLSVSAQTKGSLNALAAAALVISLVAINLRISQEERMLLEHFGDRYAQYSKRNKRLFPYVY